VNGLPNFGVDLHHYNHLIMLNAGMTKVGERMVDEVSTLFVECSCFDSLSFFIQVLDNLTSFPFW
jgi:hypothetical protein